MRMVESNQKKVRYLRETRRREKEKHFNASKFSKKEDVKMSKLQSKKQMKVKKEMEKKNFHDKVMKSRRVKEELRIA